MLSSVTLDTGLGATDGRIKVYIANRPPYRDFLTSKALTALCAGDIEQINRHGGNGWRKVFNVYAKLIFAWRSVDPRLHTQLPGGACTSWQAYRDQFLLQESSQTSLLFSPPALEQQVTTDNHVYHIIMGRTYAKSLLADLASDQNDSLNLIWHDNEFASDDAKRVVVCPYFDYRQLSNAKIMRLIELLQTY
ncbi:DUF6942 family protein [Paraglaciecola polaris]|uniref:Uncharacterized protein n=1 Tax=Paraglaciecola polaris LMG 21857 TaxID=1129793 RepID=K6YGN3_9ALTE|nr:hypothetical protein [Paraglaciecola polaris]GAC31884.1 hypothetical protein GPLA_0968 [Paraglaciecola polaris LMG 21857]